MVGALGLGSKDLVPPLSRWADSLKPHKLFKPQFLHLKWGLILLQIVKCCTHGENVTGQGERLGREYLVGWG